LYLRLNEFQPFLYQGGFALVAIITAVVIAAVVHPRASIFPALLSWQPIRWVGSRSYGIYLWHWPVFMLTRPQLDVLIGGVPLLIARLALTGVLAELSYRLVETPVRSGVLGRSWHALGDASGSRRQRLGAGWGTAAAAAVVFFSVLGHSVAGAQPPSPPAYLAVEGIDAVVSADTSALPAQPSAQHPQPMASAPLAAISATDAPAPEAVVATRALQADPALAGTRTITPTARLASPAELRPTTPTPQFGESVAAPTDLIIHVVKRGEDLFHISRRYGTTVEAIVLANDLEPADRLLAGQRLFIPLRNPATGANPDPERGLTSSKVQTADIPIAQPTIAPTAQIVRVTPTSPGWTSYIVKRGEDLFRIALRFDTPVDTLAMVNRIGHRDRLSVGQRLVVPMAEHAIVTTDNSAQEKAALAVSPDIPPVIQAPPTVNEELTSGSIEETAPQPGVGPIEAVNEAPAPFSRVTAVGDSVMLGAVNQLAAAVGDLYIDAQVSRQASAAINLLQARRVAGLLGPSVIVHVGNNGIIRADQIDAMMGVLADVNRVVLVNIKLPRRWEGPNNAVLAEKVQQYPNAVLVDWNAASVDRPELFWSDGIHLRPEGARVYAALIAAALQ
jgi:LysM repeat protein